MKKISFCIILFFSFPLLAFADHITGGEMYYTYIGSGNAQNQYSVTLKLYMRCNSGRQFNNPTIVSIFNKATGARVSDIFVNLTSQENISLPSNSNPCINNPPNVCYDVGYYNFNVSLPASTHGYVLASQVNFRIAGIHNLTPGYGTIGATYSAEIPANIVGGTVSVNNSAHFIGNDLVMICEENAFTYSFAAADADNDDLQYSFCGAFVSGNSGTVSPTPSPPFQEVPYGSGFAASAPLGALVQIDQNTGLISGIAPTAGVYVVTVCVQEIRNGVLIATQRKDLQIFIAPCTIAAAVLAPEYMLCRVTKTITLSNGSSSPLIHSYNWKFLNASGSIFYTATTSTVTYTFADTGTYKVTLWINQGEPCSDSATTFIRVYPGFFPSFTVNGICFSKPTRFFDATATAYGTVNAWSWNFGEQSVTNDFSIAKNPTYTYPTQGTKDIRLIVTNTKGCRDTIVQSISIVEKPPIQMAFRDTLTCTGDSLQLQAGGNGIFNWTPAVHMILSQSPTPVVAPVVTTVYVVQLNDNGCLNTDSVRVRVVDHVSLQAMNDTVICRGDSVRLRVFSNALHFMWSPSIQFIDPAIGNALCFTQNTTDYQVTAYIGSCSVSENVIVSTIPYPYAFAGTDTTLCFNTKGRLHGQSDGISYQWSPSFSLNNNSILDPIASPTATTTYILSAFDTHGCPKAGTDTVIVNVRPKMHAFAGRDTSVVVGQPLQMNASGGTSYQWSPPTYLSAINIPGPVAVFSSETSGFRYKVLVFDDARCVDSASILVRIYKTLPEVFVPTAFTPNRDGKNEMVMPIAVGIVKIHYFQIYNRWGQLVFTTAVNGQGWDGRINGREQGPGTFIWVVKATDYLGKPYQKKGTVTLIR